MKSQDLRSSLQNQLKITTDGTTSFMMGDQLMTECEESNPSIVQFVTTSTIELSLEQEEELKKLSLKLDQVTGSKDSIIQTGQDIIRLTQTYPQLASAVVSIWCNKACGTNQNQEMDAVKELTKNSVVNNKRKTVTMIFLANEVINKSKAIEAKKQQQHLAQKKQILGDSLDETRKNEESAMKDFTADSEILSPQVKQLEQQDVSLWREFEKVISDTIPNCFQNVIKVKKDRDDILRVVNIWKDKQIFDSGILESLYETLKDLNSMEVNSQGKQENLPVEKSRRSSNNKLATQSGDDEFVLQHLTMKDLEKFGLEFQLSEALVSIAELKSYLEENCKQQAKLEADLDLMCMNIAVVDEIDFECKIDQHKKLVEQVSHLRREMLQLVNQQFTKSDNQQFQSVLMLKKLDELGYKVDDLKRKSEIANRVAL
eukprot:403369909